MLLAVAAACSSETIEVPGETVVVKEEVIKTVEVPGETVVKEVIKEVQVPGETVVVKEEVVKEVMVPGETVVVEKVVTETVEVPGETVTVEVVKTVEVPGETVVVEKEVVKTVEVPGETVVVEKEVVKTVEVPGQTVVVEKVVTQTVEVPGETVVVEKEVVKVVEVAGPERVMVKEVRAGYVTDPTTGNVVTAPEYGGTFTHATSIEQAHVDPWFKHGPGVIVANVTEKLGIVDWAISRDKYSLRATGIVLPHPIRGLLAESWETPDDTTIVFNIRKGVNWHDKAPMNGRELTAQDIEYNLHRVSALGSGFTEPSPTGWIKDLPLESIGATDKWTVEVKLKEPNLQALMNLTLGQTGNILPPEVIKQYGDVKDWRNLVGTGPYMLTEWVEGSSVTFEKNPDYWGYDEKYPENRLPYTDKIRTLIIPEKATAMAALRSRELDYVGTCGHLITSPDQIGSLRRTNPEIVQWSLFGRSDNSFAMDVTKPPFDDLRVRKAMQTALDPETFNLTFLRGEGVSTPHGWVAVPGYHIPFAEWPAEVKMGYMYDPAGAEALLDAAGHTRGADGIRFKTALTHLDRFGLDWVQTAVEYWREIGVDVEIDIVDGTTLTARRKDHTFEGMVTALLSVDWNPPDAIRQGRSKGGWTETNINDPDYDAMVDAVLAATSIEEQMRLVREADMYMIEKHWFLWGPMAPWNHAHQPWVKGYNGEFDLGSISCGLIFARLWIDSEMKAAMGF